MKFAITASPDSLGVVGPHHVARNFGNIMCHKFRQQYQKSDFVFLCFLPKSAFLIFQIRKEWSAPVQKFLFDVILNE